MKKIFIILINKTTDFRFWSKIIFALVFSLLVRYIIAYYQSNIVDSYMWIHNDWLFILTISFITAAKSIINTWIEGFEIHRSEWSIRIIDYIENKFKLRDTMCGHKDEDSLKNKESLKHTLFMEADKGKDNITDSNLIEEYSKRSAPPGWLDPNAPTHRSWYMRVTSGPWDQKPPMASSMPSKEFQEILIDSKKSAVFYRKHGQSLRVYMKTNHIPPMFFDEDFLENISKNRSDIENVCDYTHRMKAQLAGYDWCFGTTRGLANVLKEYEYNVPLKRLAPEIREEIKLVIGFTKNTSFPIIYDMEDQLVGDLRDNLYSLSDKYKALHESPIIRECIDYNNKSLESKLGMAKYSQFKNKAFLPSKLNETPSIIRQSLDNLYSKKDD